jgi:hypothetical protein
MTKKTITKIVKDENGNDVEVTEEVEVVTDNDNSDNNGGEPQITAPVDKIKQALDDKDKEKTKETDKNNENTSVNEEVEKLKKEKADLLKEVMAKKEKLKEYEGIDASEAKRLLNEKKAAEEAAAAAEKEKLEKENNWEALKKQMVEENDKVIKGLNDQITALKEELENNKKERETLFMNNKFEESKYIRENLVLSPNKTKVLYGSYFEVENGELVAYNSPKGSSNRVRLVDANGNNLEFDKAIEKIVGQDPDKNTLLKSKAHVGAGSNVNVTGNGEALKQKMSTYEKILQGLNNEK